MMLPVKRLVFWIDGDTVHSTEHWTEVPPRRRNQYEPPGLRRPITFSLPDHWTEFGYLRAVVVLAGCDQDACWTDGRPLNEFGTIGTVLI